MGTREGMKAGSPSKRLPLSSQETSSSILSVILMVWDAPVRQLLADSEELVACSLWMGWDCVPAILGQRLNVRAMLNEGVSKTDKIKHDPL